MASTIIRAFELAKSGECQSLTDIERRLSREGHEEVEDHLCGVLVRRQLTNLIYDRDPPARNL